MASLDDFFAKKDKKKVKSTKKFVTLDEVVKNLEETNKGDNKTSQKDDIESQINHPEIQLEIFEEDDEWKNFKEEKKDYSGLKIGQLVSDVEKLNMNGNSDSSLSASDQGSKNDSGEMKGSGPANIWKAIEQPEETVVVEEQKQTEPEIETVAKPTKYLPPSMRVNKKLPPKKLNQKLAPKLCNEEFPSLKPKAAAVTNNNSKKSKK